nr:hypothetical protein GCM10020093_000250 [Planobispora longispora]BFE89106.1 hypothetical protein GCM10020093_117070 [Planobispora longispora]
MTPATRPAAPPATSILRPATSILRPAASVPRPAAPARPLRRALTSILLAGVLLAGTGGARCCRAGRGRTG